MPTARIKAGLAVLATSAVVLVTVPSVQAAGPAVEGTVYAGQVVSAPAGCTTDPASGPAPSIDWGDQTAVSPGTCTQNPSGVSTGPHTYAEEGDYSAVAHYTSPNGARTTPFTVHVADAALSATANGVAASAGVPFSGVLAHFTDADPGGAASDFTATISWGDGSSSAASVQASGSGWNVTAGHTYPSAGSYATSVMITDAGGASTSASGGATVTASSSSTSTSTTFSSSSTATSTSASPPPAARASFTLPASAAAGGTVTIDAGASRLPGVTINAYRWTVNGRQLATCAAATSELMTRTLPAGNDSVALTLLSPSGGALATTSHTIAVRAAAVRAAASRAHVAASGRVIALPGVATCLLGPQDPPSGAVAPGVAFAPRAGCDTQVQSGIIDAVGCLTEHQDPIVVKFVPGAKTSDGRRRENQVSPAGQDNLDGVNVGLDQSQLLADVENAINPAEPPLCRDPRTGATYICSATVAGESLSPGARFGGGPVQNIGPGAGFSTAIARVDTPTATAAALHGPIQLLHPACPAPPATVGQQADRTSCLDLWVADGPVRINGIDFAPPAGGELVIAPQFNLVVSQNAPASLDGLKLKSSGNAEPINADLPSAAAAAGIDTPALTMPDLPAELTTQQRQHTLPAAMLNALKTVGGFPSIGKLEISFDNDLATITFHVTLPDAFSGDGGAPVSAEVVAQVGPTQAFHVIYGDLGNTSGGGSVDLGPLTLSGFGICYRDHYSSDPTVDPCPGITGFTQADDQGLGDQTWMAVGSLNIADELNVEFRPGTNTVAGCADIPLGFAFSGGDLSRAGVAIDLSGTGGVPIAPGVFITGLAAGFSDHQTYDKFQGCLAVNALEVVTVTGNVVGVKTDGSRYTFAPDDLGSGVLHPTGGAFPYTRHLGIGVSGVVSLALPDLPKLQLASAYALYVDDPAAIFLGGGLDVGFPDGNYENMPNTGIGLRAGIAGALGLGHGFPFDLEAYADVNIQVRPLVGEINIANGHLQAIISYAPGGHGGLGFCGDVSLFDNALEASAGIAVPWSDTVDGIAGIYDVATHHVRVDLGGNACADNWLENNIGVVVQAASAAGHAPRATTAVAQVPRGLNALNLDVHSASGAPDITVTGPDGARASTAGAPIGQPVKTPSFTLLRVPALDETLVLPHRPRAGTYRVTANPGSPPITTTTRVGGFRPAISAHVSGHGTQRRLHYDVAHRAGQTVTFFEISGQVHRALGSTAGGRGSLAFTASAGHGRRSIVAEVYGNGVPNLRTTVSSYQAPTLVRLGRVAHLRVRHSRDRALVNFGSVRGASRYRVSMNLSDGTRQVITTRARRATFAPIFVDSGGTITVQAIGDGLHTRGGASVRGRLSPLFAPGKPVRRGARKPRRTH